MIDQEGKIGIEEEIILNKRQRSKKESAERKLKVMQEAQKLYKKGMNITNIAKN